MRRGGSYVVAWAPTILFVVPIAAAACFCLLQFREEIRVAQALGRLADNQVRRPALDAGGERRSPREAAYRAEALARFAAGLPDGLERDRYAAAAAAAIEWSLAHRPKWGEAWVIACHVDALRKGLGAPDALADLRRSYKFAPFLLESADWRIRVVVDQWARLDAKTRAAAANEAILLARGSTALGVHVHVLTAGTPLEASIAGRVWPAAGLANTN